MKWEYHIGYDFDTIDLNNLGKQGWELVAVHEREWENERKGYKEQQTTFYLKRQVPYGKPGGIIPYTAQYTNDPTLARGLREGQVVTDRGADSSDTIGERHGEENRASGDTRTEPT